MSRQRFIVEINTDPTDMFEADVFAKARIEAVLEQRLSHYDPVVRWMQQPNPLPDGTHTQNISFVGRKGRWFCSCGEHGYTLTGVEVHQETHKEVKV